MYIVTYILWTVFIYIGLVLFYIYKRGGENLGWWGSFRSDVEKADDEEKIADAQKILNDTVMVEIAYIVTTSLLFIMSAMGFGVFFHVTSDPRPQVVLGPNMAV